jgi:hypothetical protein
MKIHRDRPSDDDRAAKDSPPLRGRPEKVAGGVESLGRATGPPFGPLLAGRLLRTIPATSGIEYEPWDRLRGPLT